MRNKVKHFCFWGVLAVLTCLLPGEAQSATDSDFTTGVTGYIHNWQSYNETRAVDVTVLSSFDLIIQSMTLGGLNFLEGDSALVGARIYDSSSHALLASNDVSIYFNGSDITTTVPISATLYPGQSYLLGFYIETTPLSMGSGNFFIPDTLPYIEDTGLFQINSAHAIGADLFPANPNLAVPQMTVHSVVPEPISMLLYGAGLIGIAGLRKRKQSQTV